MMMIVRKIIVIKMITMQITFPESMCTLVVDDDNNNDKNSCNNNKYYNHDSKYGINDVMKDIQLKFEKDQLYCYVVPATKMI